MFIFIKITFCCRKRVRLTKFKHNYYSTERIFVYISLNEYFLYFKLFQFENSVYFCGEYFQKGQTPTPESMFNYDSKWSDMPQ